MGFERIVEINSTSGDPVRRPQICFSIKGISLCLFSYSVFGVELSSIFFQFIFRSDSFLQDYDGFVYLLLILFCLFFQKEDLCSQT